MAATVTMSNDSSRSTLVEGSLSRGLMRLTGPMLASAVLQNFQQIIDLFWVGRLGGDAVAALALSGTILMTLFPVIMGLSTGTLALVARFSGSGEPQHSADVAGQSLVMALLLGVLAGAVGWAFAEDLAGLLGARGPVLHMSAEYLRIAFAGSFTMFVLFIMSSVFQGAGNTTIPMLVMVSANIVNLVLDPLLIYGWGGLPRMEVRGAALATVISQAVAALAILVALAKGRAGFLVWTEQLRPQPELLWRMIRIGIPSSGQMLSRSLMGVVLMRVVALSGMAAVAGYGIGLRFHMIALMPAFALGNAAATMVGQNLGAGRPDRAHASARMAVGFGLLIMVVLAGSLVLFARPLVRLFNTDAAVLAVGVSFLRMVSPFYLFAVPAIVFGRSLQGAGDTMPPMILTIACLWGFQVPFALALSHTIVPPTHGIWWAIGAASLIHGLLTAAWFERGKWKTRRI